MSLIDNPMDDLVDEYVRERERKRQLASQRQMASQFERQDRADDARFSGIDTVLAPTIPFNDRDQARRRLDFDTYANELDDFSVGLDPATATYARNMATGQRNLGAAPPRRPLGALGTLLEPIVAGTDALAAGIDKLPIAYGGMGTFVPGAGGGYNPRVEQVKDAPPVIRFGAQAAPYVAASVATGGAADVAFTAQALAIAADAGDRYRKGEITGQQALFEIAMNAGPEGIAPALRGGAAGTRALRTYAASPEGRIVMQRIASAPGKVGERIAALDGEMVTLPNGARVRSGEVGAIGPRGGDEFAALSRAELDAIDPASLGPLEQGRYSAALHRATTADAAAEAASGGGALSVRYDRSQKGYHIYLGSGPDAVRVTSPRGSAMTRGPFETRAEAEAFARSLDDIDWTRDVREIGRDPVVKDRLLLPDARPVEPSVQAAVSDQLTAAKARIDEAASRAGIDPRSIFATKAEDRGRTDVTAESLLDRYIGEIRTSLEARERIADEARAAMPAKKPPPSAAQYRQREYQGAARLLESRERDLTQTRQRLSDAEQVRAMLETPASETAGTSLPSPLGREAPPDTWQSRFAQERTGERSRNPRSTTDVRYLYRQERADDAFARLDPATSNDPVGEIWVADTPELALGQGANKDGAILILDASKVGTQVRAKPGQMPEMAAQGAERITTPYGIPNDAVQAVVFPAPLPPVTARRLRNGEQRGWWTVEKQPDGTLLVTRAQQAVATLGAPPAQPSPLGREAPPELSQPLESASPSPALPPQTPPETLTPDAADTLRRYPLEVPADDAVIGDAARGALNERGPYDMNNPRWTSPVLNRAHERGLINLSPDEYRQGLYDEAALLRRRLNSGGDRASSDYARMDEIENVIRGRKQPAAAPAAPAAPDTLPDAPTRPQEPRTAELGGGDGNPPDLPDTAVAAPDPDDVGKPPTIREIEARSKPLTPEERARIHRDTDRAFYAPEDFTASTDEVLRERGDLYQRLQNVSQKVPVLRSFMSFMEPVAAARGQAKRGNAIPAAMVRREVFVAEQQSLFRAGLHAWMAEKGKLLGIDGKGIARNVGVKPDVEIPRGARGRLDDIVEHPEDYVLTAEQEAAIAEVRHTINAVTQSELEAGIDVREVAGGYFPRKVTKAPNGNPGAGGGGRSLTSRPGHVKPREFEDLRDGIASGYEYGNPIEALLTRGDSAISAIGGRRTFENIKPLGQKPSERVPQAIRDEYLDAKQAYKADRSKGNEKRLEDAKRAFRNAATKANEPSIGEAKAFSRIFPREVVDEINKYLDVGDPALWEEYFGVQRATATSSDLSAAFTMGGNLVYRNFPAWVKAMGYSIASLARSPIGYTARNIDAIESGIKAGAIKPTTEFIINPTAGRGMGSKVRAGVANLPVIKQTQRAFEWFIFVGQTEWWKGAQRLGMTDADRAELASVIRKATGSMLRPGLTRTQRKAEIATFFAGRYLMAMNALAADAVRGGVRGSEARKTLGMMFGGATALTIGAQLATDRTMPNLTDPNNRDKPWLTVKRPGGTVNLYGPLFPYLKAYASIGQNLAEGKPGDAADEAVFLGRSRLSLPMSSLIDLIYQEDIMGAPIEGPGDFLQGQAKRFAPIGARSLVEDGIEGQQEFPEGNLALLGARANRSSEYRERVDAAQRFIDAAGGDFRAANQAALAANDQEALDGIKGKWRQAIRPQIEDLGFEVIRGTPERGPRITFARIERAMVEDPSWVQGFRDELAVDITGAQSLSEIRRRYIAEKRAEYAVAYNLTADEAETELGRWFDQAEIVAGRVLKRDKNGQPSKRDDDGFSDVYEANRVYTWSQNPQLFWDAVAVGWETDSEKERTAIPRPERELVPAGR